VVYGSAEGRFLVSSVTSSAKVTGKTVSLDELDYRWTHEPPTEIFFVVLTAVVFPYAGWRLLQKFRKLAEAWASSKAGSQNL
jgi:hypothetical protein